MINKQKLELTWIGKNNPEFDTANIEPRILVENPALSNCANDPHTENMIIHGDNLLALKALLPEYEGRIKCIYIDPPYNTGTAFQPYDDSVEHSLWLSLMKPRLELLRNLLMDDGILWISIDDNECAYLILLCNEVFGRQNFIACLPTIMNLKGNQDQFGFAGTHEYTLVFAKEKGNCDLLEFKISSDDLENWEEDEIGLFKKGAPMRATGEESRREDRPFMFYPILVNGDKISTITDEEHKLIYNRETKQFDDSHLEMLIDQYRKRGFEVVLPKVDQNTYGRWRWGFNAENRSRLDYDIIVSRTKIGVSLYKKQRPELGELPSKKPKTLFYKPEYSSGNGTSQIKKLFGTNSFPYPKPEELLKDILQLSTKKGEIILDSFLGSGTTIAVAQKLERKYIGIEMGKQAYTHCKVRMDKVIDGSDQGGISKTVEWNGGGAYKFYELAPSFITIDEYGNPVIDSFYDDTKLIKAMCKLMNYAFSPSQTEYWKHGIGQGKNYIYITTQLVTVAIIQQIASHLLEGESLTICPKKFEPGADKVDSRIMIKKIPQSVLKACQFGKKEYLLPIKESSLNDIEEAEEDGE